MKMIESKSIHPLKAVEVFKTNVQHEKDARIIIHRLEEQFPETVVNFDLEDCDKVLRVACRDQILQTQKIMAVVESYGFVLEPLSDF